MQAKQSSVVLVNNLIHSGEIAASNSTNAYAVRAILLSDLDAAVVEDNTLHTEKASETSATSTGVACVLDLNSVHGTIVRGNILVGGGVTKGAVTNAAICENACADIARLERNVFVNEEPYLLYSTVCHAQGTAEAGVDTTKSVKSLEALYADAGPLGDFLLTTSGGCSTADLDAGLCATDCPPSGCAPWLLTGWGTPGYDGMFVDGGWAIRPDAAVCAVAAGGLDLSHAEAGPVVTTDIVDAARPVDGSSAGAVQYRGHCIP